MNFIDYPTLAVNGTPAEELIEIKKYLYKLAEQLNMNFSESIIQDSESSYEEDSTVQDGLITPYVEADTVKAKVIEADEVYINGNKVL